MIIIYHNGSKVVEVSAAYSSCFDNASNLTIAGFLLKVAKEYPEELLLWCNTHWKEQLNVSEIEPLFHHKKVLLSYHPSETLFLDHGIGYVEESPFIQINRDVTYPVFFCQVGNAKGTVVLF